MINIILYCVTFAWLALGLFGWLRYFHLRRRARLWAEGIEKANPSVANYIRDMLK